MAIELEDGTVVLSLPEQVEENKAKVEEVDIKVDNLAARVEAALAGVLHYKGSVATYGDLPADAEIGDVYNVIDTGANYAWTGSEWDELGSVVDLSNCVTLDGAQTITGDKTFNDAEVKFSNSSSSVYSIGKEVDQFAIRKDGSPSFLLSSSSAFLKARFAPYVDNSYDLGHPDYKWKDIYTSGVIYTPSIDTSSTILAFKVGGVSKLSAQEYNVNFYQKILPSSNDSIDIGSSSLNWKDLFLSGRANINSSSGLKIFSRSDYNYRFGTAAGGASFALFFGASADPNATTEKLRYFNNVFSGGSNNAIDLGSSTIKWKDFYLAGVAQIPQINDENGTTRIQITSGGEIRINGDLTPNGSDKKLGTSSKPWGDFYLTGNISDGTNSVNVADLKALIDYAKAQGWIS